MQNRNSKTVRLFERDSKGTESDQTSFRGTLPPSTFDKIIQKSSEVGKFVGSAPKKVAEPVVRSLSRLTTLMRRHLGSGIEPHLDAIASAAKYSDSIRQAAMADIKMLKKQFKTLPAIERVRVMEAIQNDGRTTPGNSLTPDGLKFMDEYWKIMDSYEKNADIIGQSQEIESWNQPARNTNKFHVPTKDQWHIQVEQSDGTWKTIAAARGHRAAQRIADQLPDVARIVHPQADISPFSSSPPKPLERTTGIGTNDPIDIFDSLADYAERAARYTFDIQSYEALSQINQAIQRSDKLNDRQKTIYKDMVEAEYRGRKQTSEWDKLLEEKLNMRIFGKEFLSAGSLARARQGLNGFIHAAVLSRFNTAANDYNAGIWMQVAPAVGNSLMLKSAARTNSYFTQYRYQQKLMSLSNGTDARLHSSTTDKANYTVELALSPKRAMEENLVLTATYAFTIQGIRAGQKPQLLIRPPATNDAASTAAFGAKLATYRAERAKLRRQLDIRFEALKQSGQQPILNPPGISYDEYYNGLETAATQIFNTDNDGNPVPHADYVKFGWQLQRGDILYYVEDANFIPVDGGLGNNVREKVAGTTHIRLPGENIGIAITNPWLTQFAFTYLNFGARQGAYMLKGTTVGLNQWLNELNNRARMSQASPELLETRRITDYSHALNQKLAEVLPKMKDSDKDLLLDAWATAEKANLSKEQIEFVFELASKIHLMENQFDFDTISVWSRSTYLANTAIATGYKEWFDLVDGVSGLLGHSKALDDATFDYLAHRFARFLFGEDEELDDQKIAAVKEALENGLLSAAINYAAIEGGIAGTRTNFAAHTLPARISDRNDPLRTLIEFLQMGNGLRIMNAGIDQYIRASSPTSYKYDPSLTQLEKAHNVLRQSLPILNTAEQAYRSIWDNDLDERRFPESSTGRDYYTYIMKVDENKPTISSNAGFKELIESLKMTELQPDARVAAVLSIQDRMRNPESRDQIYQALGKIMKFTENAQDEEYLAKVKEIMQEAGNLAQEPPPEFYAMLVPWRQSAIRAGFGYRSSDIDSLWPTIGRIYYHRYNALPELGAKAETHGYEWALQNPDSKMPSNGALADGFKELLKELFGEFDNDQFKDLFGANIDSQIDDISVSDDWDSSKWDTWYGKAFSRYRDGFKNGMKLAKDPQK